MKAINVVVIGAGPAGLSAALWLKNLGFVPIVLEREAVLGGMQNFNFLANDWVLGQIDVTGVDIAQQYQQHMLNEKIDIRTQQIIKAITKTDEGYGVDVLAEDSAVSQAIHCSAIIIANGTRYVGQEILSHCADFSAVDTSLIIEGPYAFVDGADKNNSGNKKILIVGAGDNAFENALMLLEKGCSVWMVARSKPKAQNKFMDKVMGHNRFTLFEYAEIANVVQRQRDDRATLSVSVADLVIDVDSIHILAGYQSNAKSVCDLVQDGVGQALLVDDNYFLQVDNAARTNVPFIYAAGDVSNTLFPCVVSAVASGALAAKSISNDFL